MARYEKRVQNDEQEGDVPMKIHRHEKKFSGHKLAVAIGHNKWQRAHDKESMQPKK